MAKARTQRRKLDEAAPPPGEFRWFASLAITAALTLAAVLATGKRTAGAAYTALCTWDCGWYKHIALHGYVSAIPPVPQDGNNGNVAFFPAYPLAGRWLAAITGLGLDDALPLAAQAACVVMFAYVFALLGRWRVDARVAMVAALSIAAHPAAVYLVMGYSESLLLAAFFGYLYWTTRASERPAFAVVAAAHGFVVAASRLVGLPLALYPLAVLAVAALRERQFPQRSELVRAAAVSGAACLGTLSFFVYCWLRWGRWNLYMQTQRIGWDVVPDYAAPLRPATYAWGTHLNRHAVAATALVVVALAVLEFVRGRTASEGGAGPRNERIALVGCVAGTMFITLAGLATKDFNSFVRYALPLWSIAAVCFASLYASVPRSARAERIAGCIAAVVLGWMFVAVGLFDVAVQTLRGSWIA